MAYQPKSYRKFLAGSVSAAVVASALVAPAASAASADFPDVPKGHWAYDAITTLTAKDIINGYTDGSFKPSQLLNRGQAAALFTNALGLEIPEKLDTFKDLKSTSYFAQYAAAVEAAGVFGGYADGNFGAGDNLTREQMASVLVRAFDFEATGEAVDLIDLDKAHSSHRENIKILAQNGISVNEDKTFDPKDPVSRAHFATFLYRSMVATGMLAENPAVESVKAINGTTVEVTFKEAVSEVKASDFTVDGLTVVNAVLKQENSKTVVLTTSGQEGGKKYTVKHKGEVAGSFEGISSVIPANFEVKTTSVQGVVGKEVTLTVDANVKEKNIPITFNVDAANNSLNKDLVKEVMTNEEGIATFTYTQYNGGYTDDVAVYATGDASKRQFAKVYWGVSQLLTVEAADDNKGTALANGEKKVYKVTLVDGKNGKGLSNETVNVTFAQNIGVTADKLSKATITDPRTGVTKTPYQLSNGKTEEVTITTDKDGIATFTVTGTNTEATPIVFWDANDSDKVEATELQDATDKVVFSGAQLNHKFTITAEGSDHAATGLSNGRVYKVAVSDKDGKAYKGGIINLAFNEDLDRVIGTDTNAAFTSNDDLEGELLSGVREAERQLKLNDKGEAEFIVYSNVENDYATPVVWIDQNWAENYQTGVLESGEPTLVGEKTFFEAASVKASQLKTYKDGKAFDKTFTGLEVAEFRYNALNQSGKVMSNVYSRVTFEVVNNGSAEIEVAGKTVAAYGRTTVKVEGYNPSVSVTSNGNDGSVSVSANGYQLVDGKESKYLGNHTATATFSKYSTGTLVSGFVTGVDTDAETITVSDQTFKYTGAAYKEKGQVITKAEFERLVNSESARVTVSRDSEDKLTFNILETVDAPEATITAADVDGDEVTISGSSVNIEDLEITLDGVTQTVATTDVNTFSATFEDVEDGKYTATVLYNGAVLDSVDFVVSSEVEFAQDMEAYLANQTDDTGLLEKINFDDQTIELSEDELAGLADATGTGFFGHLNALDVTDLVVNNKSIDLSDQDAAKSAILAEVVKNGLTSISFVKEDGTTLTFDVVAG
ncbi:S-layer homology domain-containing protein [Cytobacillus sp. NCCP-133]|uniref:S-layer homology domain-containing protein n=1 Tax=Cytobacillus sp. NCCP-133 TaxID=766848 RepID=UPI0022320CFC|nr:S-layer homology domain-containing protein [Cytobacillus sp. NCCP-133]GLB58997.1 hypothetical protein NCCP133_11300 [Cytobacillus sp. NCCP-133]